MYTFISPWSVCKGIDRGVSPGSSDAALARLTFRFVVLVQSHRVLEVFFFLLFYQIVVVAADPKRRQRLFGAAPLPEVRLQRPEVVGGSSGTER